MRDSGFGRSRPAVNVALSAMRYREPATGLSTTQERPVLSDRRSVAVNGHCRVFVIMQVSIRPASAIRWGHAS